MLRAGADRQRLRPSGARFLDAPRRGARPQHARAARQAGASRRARGRARLLLRKESRMSRPLHQSDMATELQLAAQRHELFLEYQPQLDLRTGDLAGVEALMRWQSPTFGRVGPDVFIPLAERTGAIDDLTEWGLRTALWQWLAWRDQGVKVGIAFNISALILRDVDFPDYLQRLCLRQGVPCEALTLEVTEGATQNIVPLLDTLTRFRIKGMGLALDDFGTGYSSLLQLRQLP